MAEFRVLQRWREGALVLKKGKQQQPVRVWTGYVLQTRKSPESAWVDVPVVYRQEGTDEVTGALDG